MGEAEPGVLGGSGCVSRAHRGASVYMPPLAKTNVGAFTRAPEQTNKYKRGNVIQHGGVGGREDEGDGRET